MNLEQYNSIRAEVSKKLHETVADFQEERFNQKDDKVIFIPFIVLEGLADTLVNQMSFIEKMNLSDWTSLIKTLHSGIDSRVQELLLKESKPTNNLLN